MSVFKNKTTRLYLFFFLLIVLFYWDTRDAGFVTDFLGWQHNFDNNSFWQILHPAKTGIKSFYHLTHLQMYVLSSLFGTWGLPWFLIFAALFALNGLFVFLLFDKLFTLFDLKNGSEISFIAVLCFLLSPFQAEVMVWRASFHYFTAFAMMLGYLLLLLKYLQKADIRYVIGANLMLACSVFALEFFYFTPFLSAILILFWRLNAAQIPNLKKTLISFVLIPLSILCLYFVAYKLTYGKWVAHYGIDAHKNILSPESFATYAKYIVKHLFFIRYLPNTEKVAFFGYFDKPLVSWTGLILALTAGISGLVFFKKMTIKSRFIYFNFVFYSLLIAPVITFYFVAGMYNENDRYGYMASPFLFMGVTLALSGLKKPIFRGLMAIFICFNLFFLIKTTQLWFQSERVMTHLMKNYRWWDSDEVLSLNSPDSFEGMYLFRIWDSDSGIPEALEAFTHRKVNFTVFDVQRYNMLTGSDGVHVRVNTPDSLTVSFNQFGTWWWRESNYETPQYIVRDGVGNYTLKLKPTTKKRAIIFQVGWDWKEVDLTKIGTEQW